MQAFREALHATAAIHTASTVTLPLPAQPAACPPLNMRSVEVTWPTLSTPLVSVGAPEWALLFCSCFMQDKIYQKQKFA